MLLLSWVRQLAADPPNLIAALAPRPATPLANWPQHRRQA